jgi:rhodanese-related sulfurtransferase
VELKLKPNDPKKAQEYFEAKMAFTTGPIEVQYAREKQMEFNLIDVRAAVDYEEEHAKGAASLPENQWDTFQGLSKEKLNVLYCYSEVCHLAARAAVKFARAGFPVMEMNGGFQAWKDHELETDRGIPSQAQEKKKTA